MEAKEDHLSRDLFKTGWRNVEADSLARTFGYGSFDNVLEYLVPERQISSAFTYDDDSRSPGHDDNMEQYKKDFYAYHQNLMETLGWSHRCGFSDGIVVGATLDRNGLRPSRYSLTEQNELVVAFRSMGVVDLDPSSIILKGRLQPGKILIADLDRHQIVGMKKQKNHQYQ